MQSYNCTYRNSKLLKPGCSIKYPKFMAVKGNTRVGAKILICGGIFLPILISSHSQVYEKTGEFGNCIGKRKIMSIFQAI